MKREIAHPRDFTPEYIIEEIKDQITANPFVVRYDYERTVNPEDVPRITITLELIVGKNPEVNKEELLKEVQKNLDRLKRI